MLALELAERKRREKAEAAISAAAPKVAALSLSTREEFSSLRIQHLDVNVAVDKLSVFFGKVPSKKNSKQIVGGKKKRIISSDAFLDWEAEETARLGNSLGNFKPPYFIRAQFIAGSTRVFDISNALEGIVDLFVDLGLLEDDRAFWLQNTECRFAGAIQGQPQAKITVAKMPENVFSRNYELLRLIDGKPNPQLKVEAKAKGLSVTALKAQLWAEMEAATFFLD